MKDTMREIGLERSRTVGQLGLPVQAAPIDRTSTGVALADGSGVEAAGWWDIVKKVGSGLGTIGDQFFD